MLRKDDGRTIAKCLISHKNKCEIEEKDPQVIESLFERVLLDHPSIYTVESYEYNVGADKTTITPNYTISKWDYRKIRKQVYSAMEKLVTLTEREDHYESLVAIHDALSHIEYRSDTHSHSIIGPLIEGYGVCEGISKLVLQLCQSHDIECRIARGKNSSGIPHCWNQVRLKKKWYNFDMTWDITNSDKDCIAWDYFLVSDAVLSKDHFDSDSTVKCVDDDLDPYKSNGLECMTASDLESILCNVKDTDCFAFRTVNYSELSNVFKILMKLCPKKTIKILHNDQQNTFHIRMFDKPPEMKT